MLEATIEPNWTKAAAKLAEKTGEEAGEKTLAEQAGKGVATAVGVDAVMVGSLILGGVGTIGAAILTIQEGEEIAEIHGKVTALSTKLAEGFKIGASGGLPPSDSQAMPGYSQGVQNFNAAKAKLKELNPTADDNAIRSAIIAQVNAAASQAQSQILAQAQNTLWDDYASKHVDTWYHSYERERWEAWSNIFGDDPRGDSRYMRYRNDHTPGRLGC